MVKEIDKLRTHDMNKTPIRSRFFAGCSRPPAANSPQKIEIESGPGVILVTCYSSPICFTIRTSRMGSNSKREMMLEPQIAQLQRAQARNVAQARKMLEVLEMCGILLI